MTNINYWLIKMKMAHALNNTVVDCDEAGQFNEQLEKMKKIKIADLK